MEILPRLRSHRSSPLYRPTQPLQTQCRSTPSFHRKIFAGAIFYCGPYLLNEEALGYSSWFGGFFSCQMGWSYFGKRDWYNHPEAKHATAPNNITPAFPPTFITDGNTGSFEPHGRELEAKIREKGVYVEPLYYPIENRKLGPRISIRLLNQGIARMLSPDTCFSIEDRRTLGKLHFR